jgi:chromosome partitioning protein
MIISFLNQKGGVGKTTLAIHIAAALAGNGSRILLVDADPQHSALDWSEARQENTLLSVVGLPNKTLHKEIPNLAMDFDHVIIDGPPRVYDVARSAILASDLVIIPIQPSPYDVWAAQEIVGLVEEATVFKENFKTVFVVNRRIVNTAIGRDVINALQDYKFPVLKSTVCQRVAFAETAAQGKTVMDQDMSSLASQEIIALANEITEVLSHDENSRLWNQPAEREAGNAKS